MKYCKSVIVFHTAILSLFFHQFAVSSKVEFYQFENHIGLLAEMPTSESCSNLPRHIYNMANSLKTTSCIMIYKGENCTQASIKVRLGSHPSLANVTHAYNENFKNSIRSFHQCSGYAGSSDNVNVTFYEGDQNVAEYQNMCGCITLPDTTNSVTRLVNHGNCIRLYLSQFGMTPGCTGSYHTLQGGTSYISENIQNLTRSGSSWKRIMAISPCSEELTKCVKLSATVIKFEIDTDPKLVSVMSSSSDMSMSISTTFRNNGSAIVSEEYTAKKSIIEATEIRLAESYSVMQNWTVESGMTAEFTANVPLVSRSTVTASLTSAYTREETSSFEDEEIRRSETSTEFSVSQKIEIEACTQYNVNSFVRMIHNYPMKYKVYSKISGKIGGERRLTAQEIKERLEGLEYVRDHDSCTVIAMGYGTMLVDFGVETLIDGEGGPIKGCSRKYIPSESSISNVVIGSNDVENKGQKSLAISLVGNMVTHMLVFIVISFPLKLY